MAERDAPVRMGRPDITQAELDAAMRVLASGRLAGGEPVRRFERSLARAVGTPHAVAVSSGTDALELILRALDVGPGDEVLTTPLSFAASATCALLAGATPVFADVDPERWTLAPEAAERAVTPRTRAVLAVHLFGFPADLAGLAALCERHGLPLVEDACESLGTCVEGVMTGAAGRAGAFGFYPNKQITTGEGGAVVTHDASLAARLRRLRNQGRAEGISEMRHVELGRNARLSAIAAAIGTAQLGRIDAIVARRAAARRVYAERLGRIEQIELHGAEAEARLAPADTVSWFAVVVAIEAEKEGNDATAARRDRVLGEIAARGIESRAYFPAIHLQPLFRERFGYGPGAFPVAESLAARAIALPFFSTITEEEIERVARALSAALVATR